MGCNGPRLLCEWAVSGCRMLNGFTASRCHYCHRNECNFPFEFTMVPFLFMIFPSTTDFGSLVALAARRRAPKRRLAAVRQR
jgi:hypothetical protein